MHAPVRTRDGVHAQYPKRLALLRRTRSDRTLERAGSPPPSSWLIPKRLTVILTARRWSRSLAHGRSESANGSLLGGVHPALSSARDLLCESRECKGDCPESARTVSIERVVRDAAPDSGCERFGLLTIFEVSAGDMFDQRRCGEQD